MEKDFIPTEPVILCQICGASNSLEDLNCRICKEPFIIFSISEKEEKLYDKFDDEIRAIKDVLTELKKNISNLKEESSMLKSWKNCFKPWKGNGSKRDFQKCKRFTRKASRSYF